MEESAIVSHTSDELFSESRSCIGPSSPLTSNPLATVLPADHVSCTEHIPIRIGLYSSSSQRILFVGEGDFSFVNALAMAFESAPNLVATSLDTEEELLRQYGSAAENLSNLRTRQALLLHGVDATCMATHENLRGEQFDRIVFNNPNAGFFHGRREHDESVIQLHKDLVNQFFHNAARLLAENGEIHVLHKVRDPYSRWNLEELANMNGLLLKQCVPFEKKQYPGYVNKKGAGPKCGETYNLGECNVFKFTLCPLFERPPLPSPFQNTDHGRKQEVPHSDF